MIDYGMNANFMELLEAEAGTNNILGDELEL